MDDLQDLEDLLDEFAAEALRRKVVSEGRASSSKVHSFIPACFSGLSPSAVKFNISMRSKMSSITSQMEELSLGWKRLPEEEHQMLHGEEQTVHIWNFFKQRLGEERDDQDLYFFTQLKKKTSKGSRIDGSVGTGTWKGEDGGREIVNDNLRIGTKKRFRYENKDPDQHGGWIMHEYSLDSSFMGPDQHSDYVVCRIRKSEPALKKNKRGKCQEVDSEKKKKRSKVQEVDSEPLPLAVPPATSRTAPTTTMVQQQIQLEDETRGF
ncbi:NAC domain-containing protein 2-like [Pistacia vera]|uniref:NAC domain-containing protein 2-like n=1 Tax=Pistacia vera TaxID=55513 RepID=UPI0012634BDB|nr:NAC domain-containing protein 2-like [Pistacia vera]